MKNKSVWNKKVESPEFPNLNGDHEADVVIIGGGITGVTCAYLLSIAGRSVILLEARKIAEGSTGYSTGNLYAQVGGEGLHKIAEKFNEQKLKEVLDSRIAAIELIEQIIATNNIQCDFNRVPWSLFSAEDKNQTFIEKERKAAELGGLSIEPVPSYPLSIKGGFSIPSQAQFNPAKYVTSLASLISSESCRIFENSRVIQVDQGDVCTVQTEQGSVRASHVIMATHTPKGIYAVHTLLGPYREYAVAARLNSGNIEPGIYWEMQETEHYSVRTCDSEDGRIIMVLGEMHKVGQKDENLKCIENLENFLRSRFDVGRLVTTWSAQQYRPADAIPFIGISPGDSKTYIATGFGADGLTYGTLAAMIITDDILGRANRWAHTFDASRITPLASAPNFIKENANVAFELVKDWLTKDEAENFSDVVCCDGKVLTVNGSKRGVHRDERGELHVVSPVCPHMGCIVNWNTAEQTWDCPCHGSRFTKDGEVLEGPAINPLKRIMIEGQT